MPISLKKRGEVYHMRGTVAGHRVRKSTFCSRRAQAEAVAIRTEQEILDRYAFGITRTLTFAEAAGDYLEAGGEARFLEPVLIHFGPDQLVADIDDAALAIAERAIYPDASPATVNRQLIGKVSAIVNHAARNNKAKRILFTRRKARGQRKRWLDPTEFDRLLDCAQDHLRPILAALVGTGCRVSEALTAQGENWHPATGEIWLPETKNGHPRMVQMPARARDQVLPGAAARGAVFRTPAGTAYEVGRRGATPIKTAFNSARDSAGLGVDVTPHVLRHTWATWYYAQTKDFGRMLDLGGWRTVQTAEIYRKLAPANLGDRLHKAGWDFTRLGDALPPVTRDTGLRVVK